LLLFNLATILDISDNCFSFSFFSLSESLVSSLFIQFEKLSGFAFSLAALIKSSLFLSLVSILLVLSLNASRLNPGSILS